MQRKSLNQHRPSGRRRKDGVLHAGCRKPRRSFEGETACAAMPGWDAAARARGGVRGEDTPRCGFGAFRGCGLRFVLCAHQSQLRPARRGGEAGGGAQGGEKRELASATHRSGQAEPRAGGRDKQRGGDGGRSAKPPSASLRARGGGKQLSFRPKPRHKKRRGARRVGHVWDWQPASRASFKTMNQRQAGRTGQARIEAKPLPFPRRFSAFN